MCLLLFHLRLNDLVQRLIGGLRDAARRTLLRLCSQYVNRDAADVRGDVDGHLDGDRDLTDIDIDVLGNFSVHIGQTHVNETGLLG